MTIAGRYLKKAGDSPLFSPGDSAGKKHDDGQIGKPAADHYPAPQSCDSALQVFADNNPEIVFYLRGYQVLPGNDGVAECLRAGAASPARRYFRHCLPDDLLDIKRVFIEVLNDHFYA